MKKWAIVAAAVGLAACNANYTWYGLPKVASDDQINAKVEALAGKPIELPITALGAPDQDQMVAGHHLMVWNGEGLIEGAECKLNVAVSADNKVARAWFTGHRGGCAEIAKRLP